MSNKALSKLSRKCKKKTGSILHILSQIYFFFLNILEWNGVVMFLWDSPMYSQYLKYSTAIVARRACGSKIHSELSPVLQWESTDFLQEEQEMAFLLVHSTDVQLYSHR